VWKARSYRCILPREPRRQTIGKRERGECEARVNPNKHSSSSLNARKNQTPNTSNYISEAQMFYYLRKATNRLRQKDIRASPQQQQSSDTKAHTYRHNPYATSTSPGPHVKSFVASDMENQELLVGEVSRLPPDSQLTAHRRDSSHVRTGHDDIIAESISANSPNAGTADTIRAPDLGATDSSKRAKSPGSRSPSSAGEADGPCTDEGDHTKISVRVPRSIDAGVEDGISLVRNLEVNEGTLHQVHRAPADNRLVTRHKGLEVRPLPPEPICCDTGPLHKGTLPDVEKHAQNNSDHHMEHNENPQLPSRRVHCTLNQAGGSQQSGGNSLRTQLGPTSHRYPRETSKQSGLGITNDTTVLRTNYNGSTSWHPEDHHSSVKTDLWPWKRPTQHTQNTLRLPLNVPDLPQTIDLEKVDAFAQRLRRPDLMISSEWLRNPEYFTKRVPQNTPLTPTQSQIAHKDWKKMLTVCTRISRTEARAWCKWFTVPELHKQRRRPICWPQYLNKLCPIRELLVTNHIEDTVRQVRDAFTGDWATAADFKSSFQQLQLHPKVRLYFAIHCKHGTIAYNTAPMGFTLSPQSMHDIATCIALEALNRITTTATVSTRVYIDNVRFIGTQTDVQKCMKSFLDVCNEVGATINDDDTLTPHQTSKFLGQVTDLKDKTVRLADKVCANLRRWQTRTLDRLSFNELRELVSLLLWCGRVRRHNLAIYYPTMKFYRRRAAEMAKAADPEQPNDIWPSVVSQLQQWLRECLDNRPIPVQAVPDATTSTYYLFTDASTKGWGAVLFTPDNQVHSLGAPWDKHQDCSSINELEARALKFGIKGFAHLLHNNSHMVLLVDNSSVVSAVKRGSAYAALLNKDVAGVLHTMGRMKTTFSIVWISTLDNVADGISRGTRIVPSRLPAGVGTRKPVDVPVPFYPTKQILSS